MQERPSRRSVLAGSGALALAALAGCTGGGDDATASRDPTQTTTAPTRTDTTTEQSETTAGDDDPSVAWGEVADFRTWLTDYSTLPSSNSRFDYQGVNLEPIVSGGRASFLDLAVEDVDGFLTQSGNAIYLGGFDAEALTATVEDSADHDVTGEHEGYTTAMAAERGTEFALGDDAVLAGSDLSVWIDTHVGERDRLEETDPVFTRIFRRLPERGIVTAQYGTPAGGEIDADAIEAWGNSMASLEAETGTWVFALEDGTSEAPVDELEAELGESAFTDEVTNRETDGRFVVFTATMAIPE